MFNFNAKKMLSKDMAIDLGTASVIVYVDGNEVFSSPELEIE